MTGGDHLRVDAFDHEGYELVYETHGEGPRLTVLVHGLLLDAGLNRAVAQAIAAADGHRVVLPELLGHGRSDKPTHASAHRMDAYADQVVALLDHLGAEQAVIGGTSLGANVALEVAARDPQRVRAMILEMPALEWAGPAAGIVFIPLLLLTRFGGPVAEAVTRAARALPRTGYGPLDALLNAGSMRPREIAAVLHGILIGPAAPRIEQREAMTMPALIIGHARDAIHPFSDAENLSRQLPSSRLVRARSVLELRTRPTRLTTEIRSFLDEVWQPLVTGEASAAAE